MNNGFHSIFNYLDAPKKYYGATMVEIIVAGGVVVIGLIVDKAAFSFIMSIFILKLVRSITNAPKFVTWKRWIYFSWHKLSSSGVFI